MNGQMKKSKKQIVDKYIACVNPYEKPQPIAFDLRGYAAFVAEKGLKTNEITPDMMKKFSKGERYNQLEKAARNAGYLAMIDRGIAQLEAGKGQEHDLIEVD